MPKLSAVIITFNEEANIARCIGSLKDIADEVLVVDSFSTDRTEEICRELGASFLQHPWKGYDSQKNYANSMARYDNVLSIDADEVLSDRLRQSILAIKNDWKKEAYAMNRLTNYCGKWIRHGSWYPDRKIRLFDRTKGEWQGEIHEEVIFKEAVSTGFLKGDILHYSYTSISDHIRQANNFTDITARMAFENGKRSSLLKILVNPCVRFIRDYIFLGGFLDGYSGWLVCRISAQANAWKYIKLRDLQRQNHPPKS